MPYLTQQQKDDLKKKGKPIETPGELTYDYTLALINASTTQIRRSLKRTTEEFISNNPKNFSTYCSIMGSLDCTCREFIRRKSTIDISDEKKLAELEQFSQSFYKTVIAPYEDQKIKENGDVY